MTSVLTRPPLEPLSMTSTQRPTRRRSARQAFEDDELVEHGVGKKTRMDAVSSSVAVANGAEKPKRKSKRIVYEDADDFQFSKTKLRKSKEQAANVPDPITENKTGHAPSIGASTPTRRKKEASPTARRIQEDSRTSTQGRRRSARLSSEKEQVHAHSESAVTEHRAKRATSRKTLNAFSEIDEEVAMITVKKPRQTSKPSEKKAQSRSRSLETSPHRKGQAELNIVKPRSPTKITLPFADTPIIKRNKEMRRGGQGSRRSSAGTRGRRASSLIDSGTSNAIPHYEVDTNDFYKHIAQDLPEPRRMKQLLVWCGSRALPEKPSGGNKDTSVVLAARAIQQELLEDFAQKSELSDWFSREDSAPVTIIKKVNPRNERMAEMVKELEEEIKRLQGEEKSWKTVNEASLSLPDTRMPAAQSDLSGLDIRFPSGFALSSTILDDDIQSMILASLSTSSSSASFQPNDIVNTTGDNLTLPQNTLPKSIANRVGALIKAVEPAVDVFAEGIHQLLQYRKSAEQVADCVLGAAAMELEDRDSEARKKAGMANVGANDLLGALGKVMAQREKMGR